MNIKSGFPETLRYKAGEHPAATERAEERESYLVDTRAFSS